MKYMLLIYGNEDQMQKQENAVVQQAMAAYGAYTEAMKKAGVLVVEIASSRRDLPARCGSPMARQKCSTDPTPKPRSNSGAIT
jgi:hypothetical protein